MLTAGDKIGIYEVVSSLGAGGMGEVYRARDTKLQRDVALKILPETMARDAQRMARFEREALVLASLNHPNIAAIYGLEESNGVRALVMELVEGETLAERISVAAVSSPSAPSGDPAPAGSPRGGVKPPLQIDEALPIAKQIAEALEYAHERGVIHRDLKPANVKITPEGTVKVLDFGLAKVLDAQDSSVTMDMANSPTLSAMATQAGVILGTAAYMSPEQAKGQRVDRRADIWAFGCVMYEMLSGQKPFEGETISDVLASVIKSEPDWAAIPETTPKAIKKLVYRCLQKDQRQRLQAIGEARIAIEETISGTGIVAPGLSPADADLKVGATTSPLRRALPWALTVTTILFAATTVWFAFQPKPQQSAMRLTVQPPENAQFAASGLSISPDGHYLTFRAPAGPDKPTVLWLRPLDSVTAEQIPGTEGAFLPFWSPDSGQIGFYANGRLEKVAVSGGAPQTLCTANGLGATWNRDGVILFTSGDSLYRVPDTGGSPTLVASPDAGFAFYRFPQFLPDGRHFLVLAGSGGQSAKGAAVGTVEVGSPGSSKTETLLEGSSEAFYARPGYLFYAQGGNLMARGFNARSLKFTGQPVPVAENVHLDANQWASFSVSQSGVLTYREGAGAAQDEMTWFNRKGQKLGTVGQTGSYSEPAISPDGTRLAVNMGSSGGSTRDIWVYDLKRGTGSRLTFTPAFNTSPVWSPDGSLIYFDSNRDGKAGIYEKAADGLGNTQMLFQSSHGTTYLQGLSPDSRYLMYMNFLPTQSLWALPLSGDRKPFVYLQGHPSAYRGMFSPNGRYVAYASTETGRSEVYVETFPQHQGKWQISAAGGDEPMWRSDGKELFYLGPDNELMSVDLTTGSGQFQASTPRPLFKQALVALGMRNQYAVSPDGQRFLMLVPTEKAAASSITVVVNWPALLKKP